MKLNFVLASEMQMFCEKDFFLMNRRGRRERRGARREKSSEDCKTGAGRLIFICAYLLSSGEFIGNLESHLPKLEYLEEHFKSGYSGVCDEQIYCGIG